MEINVSRYSDNKYSFMVNGVSYIGNPKRNTAMFVAKKVDQLLSNLFGMVECLVFVERGVEIPAELMEKNCFVFSDAPQRDYSILAEKIARDKLQSDLKRRYTLTDGGYYVGENVSIGQDTFIEPGAVIGHDVKIGTNGYICAGSSIKHAQIGNNFLCNENASIGTNGFTMTVDEEGNRRRISSLGKVFIGNDVEIGAHDCVSRGTASDTVLGNYVKLDSHVYIGHDTVLERNVEVASGATVAGYVVVRENSFIGMNATIRNRIELGKNCKVSMGAVVSRSVEENSQVTGNFAIEHSKFISELKATNGTATRYDR